MIIVIYYIVLCDSKFSFETIEYEVKRTQKIGICTYITILCNMYVQSLTAAFTICKP